MTLRYLKIKQQMTILYIFYSRPLTPDAHLFRNFSILDMHNYLAVESVLPAMVLGSSNAVNKHGAL